VTRTLSALIACLACTLAFTSACSSPGAQVDPQPPGAPAAPQPPASPPPAEPAAVGANELGQVPVLMFHRIVPAPKSVYDRTPADFRAELERLARENYVPVTAAEFTAGNMDIPAGAHPVVLTFDDADASQFSLTPAGTPADMSAVAILQDVARQHPAFRPVATFYVNNDPFAEPGGARALTWLHAHGFDIGNHTMTHANLRKSDAVAAQQEIGRDDQAIRRSAPGVQPTTIALPFGVHPRSADLALNGTADGIEYHYRGAFLVGANPATSPFSDGFDQLRIPRIRSQGSSGAEAGYGSSSWLDKLAADPANRYTSDGDPQRISFPRTTHRVVSAAYQNRANPY
jgi:peptidoglycan/xylan/chitin deacetylase (PgdA/CDA1 family)